MKPEPMDVCADCGHFRKAHWLGFAGRPAGCSVNIDKRHATVGGPGLVQCGCKSFRAVVPA